MKVFYNQDKVIDAEALRLYVFEQLDRCLTRVKYLKTSERFTDFWHNLHLTVMSLTTDDKATYIATERQLVHLDGFIEQWMQVAVESSARFEFFIQAKASEIGSSNQQQDYFQALGIRHDQLLALVRVLISLLDNLERWVNLPISELLQSPMFVSLVETPIEEQIFLEAQVIAQKRLQS